MMQIIILLLKNYSYNSYFGKMDTMYLNYYHFNNHNNLILRVDSYYMPSEGYYPVYKEEYSFDSQDRFVEALSSRWNSDSTSWIKQIKYNLKYKQANLYDSVFNYFWVDSLQYWDLVSRVNYYYNSDNEFTKVSSYSYLANMVSNIDTFTYDINGYPYQMLSKMLNQDYIMTNTQLHIRINNQYGDNTTYFIYFWDKTNVDWTPIVKQSNEFNNNYDVSEILFPMTFYDRNFYNKMLLKISSLGFDTINEVWENNGNTIRYYYSLKTLDIIDRSETTKAKVYPNPVNEVLTFDLPPEVINADIVIYDINGRVVERNKLPSNNQINVSNLKQGNYVFRIVFKDKVFTGKFIIVE